MRLKGRRVRLCGMSPGPPGKTYRTQREGLGGPSQKGGPAGVSNPPPQANAALPTATSAKAPEVSALLMEQADQQRPIKESNGDTPRWARHSA